MIWFIVFLLVFIVWFSYRYSWWKKTIDYKYPRILMYHMVRQHIKRNRYNSLRVDPKMFESQIKYLSENGWSSFTMSEAIANRKILPAKSVIITFDDGYEDNFTNAFPILKKYNFKATIYLVVERHDIGLKYERKLQDEQIEALIDSGLVEIGAHTVTHANLLKLDENSSCDEICKSKTAIENKFNIICNSFAYPFGAYKPSDMLCVKNCEYTSSVTTKSGIADLNDCNLYEIPRITVKGKDNLLAFKLKLKSGTKGAFK